MNRRRALAVLGTVGLTSVAGCLGEEMEYTAEPAVIPDATAQGYEEDGPEAIEFDETIEMAGFEQEVHIRTWSASYADPDDETVVFLFSTPDVSVAGISVNPLARLSGADLVARVLDEGLGSADAEGGIRDIESEDEQELTVLDEERTLQVFSAIFEADGAEQADEDGEIPIKLYVLSFSHEDDVILSVGFHPDMEELAEELGEDELAGGAEAEQETDETAEEIKSLMESIEHPADVETD